MTSSGRHKHPYDTYHEVVINHAKFDVYTSSSFRGVKTGTIALYKFIQYQILLHQPHPIAKQSFQHLDHT